MQLRSLVSKIGELACVWPDHVSVAATLGRPWQPAEAAAWRRLVEERYSRQALKAGYALFGRSLRLEDLAHIAQEPDRWLSRAQEASGLAPLLGPFVKVRTTAPDNLAALREGALRRGLTPAAWKWLRRQHPSTTAKLFAFGFTVESVWWTNLLSEAQPDVRISSRWLEEGRPYLAQPLYEHVRAAAQLEAAKAERLNLTRFFRLLPVQCDPRALGEYELLATGMLLGLRDSRYRLSVGSGRTWLTLLRQLRRFADERENLARAKAALQDAVAAGQVLSWPPLLGSGQHLGLEFHELCSSTALEQEGVLMAHCVGDGAYTVDCQLGHQAILSLREPVTGTRATLQLRRLNGRWTLGQLAGTGNTRVPQVFWKVARVLAAGEVQANSPLAYAA